MLPAPATFTAALLSLHKLLHHSRRFGRPHRGNRADHWTSAAIMGVTTSLPALPASIAATPPAPLPSATEDT